MTTAFMLALDGDGEPTLWLGDTAVVRRSDLALPSAWNQLADAATQSTSLLRRLAADEALLWTVARRAIEDELVEWRDAHTSMPLRNNGFVIRGADGTPSDIIRFGPEHGVRVALLAIADHLDEEALR